MKVTKIWFDVDNMYVLTADGNILSQSLKYYPRLKKPQRQSDSNILSAPLVYIGAILTLTLVLRVLNTTPHNLN